MRFEKEGIRITDYKYTKQEIKSLKQHWNKHLATIPAYPSGQFKGKGIVYTVGGIKYTTCAWVSISLLRKMGCNLPIEVWHLGSELSKSAMQKFKDLNVTFRDFTQIADIQATGFILKPLSILYSQFEEVLFIDADNNCVTDPTDLFFCNEYREHGAVFWPDFWLTAKDNSIWKIIGTNEYDVPEQESGQILINKKTCWQALNLCLYFNEYGSYYNRILYGDKDTFKFAWYAVNQSFHMVTHSVGTCGYEDDNLFFGTTMVQHGPNSEIYFLHRNLLKWDITQRGELTWKKIKTFLPTATHKEIYLRGTTERHPVIDIKGEVTERSFTSIFPSLEQMCLDFLEDWRKSTAYKDFLHYSYFADNRYFPTDFFEIK